MLIQRQTSISGNIVLLGMFLRKNGFVIGAKEEADAMHSLTLLPIDHEQLFKSALKSILSKSKWQYEQFDDLYEEFWKQLRKAVDSKTKALAEETVAPTAPPPSLEVLKSWLYNESPNEEKQVAAFSNLEVLGRQNFNDMSTDDIRLMMALLRKMAKKLAHQKSRLKKRSSKNKTLDMRRTCAANLRMGGDMLRLQFSEPKDKKFKIVLLCDVSKSMGLYSQFLVHLIYAFQNAYDQVETFVFSTALHRVTDLLENHEFDKAFDLISSRVPHWSGGTTIGNCLQSFVDTYGPTKLTRKTVVFILSDGWDTGDSSNLKNAMKQIHKRSKKIIWLNPLAGNPDFSPEVIGLQTALPYIDVLESAHNLESLKRAMKHLKSGKRKPPMDFLPND